MGSVHTFSIGEVAGTLPAAAPSIGDIVNPVVNSTPAIPRTTRTFTGNQPLDVRPLSHGPVSFGDAANERHGPRNDRNPEARSSWCTLVSVACRTVPCPV